MNRVYIKTYGCQMNVRDSQAVAAMLCKRGYIMVEDEDSADVVLLNTCAVRDKAEQKAIGKTGHLLSRKKRGSNFLVGIMGCMAQNREKKLLDRLPDLDLLVGTQKFHRIPEYLDRIISEREQFGPSSSTVVDLDEEEGSQNTIRDHLEENHKISAFVSIMQGCNMKCTFCIVPKTRGRERSRSIEDIIQEVGMLASTGIKEVTLLGQTVTSYGRREIPFQGKKSPFVQLLEAVNEIDGIERIRFTSPHPRGFREDLVRAYDELPKLCEYVHLPLQSGSDNILRAMKRPYTRDLYRRIVGNLRAVVPEMSLSTDIIVGFPGESEADFAETRSLFEEIGFDMAYIFKYSTRSGTPATTMPNQVDMRVKEERNQELLALLEVSSRRRNKWLIGAVQEILVEGPARKGERMYTGRTRGNRKVVFRGRRRLVGELVPVLIEDASVSTLYGSIVTEGTDDLKSTLTFSRV